MRRQVNFDFRFMVHPWLWSATSLLWLGLPATAQRPTIITFDAPGAGTGTDRGTAGIAINPVAAITGFYFDSSLRQPQRAAVWLTASCALPAAPLSPSTLRTRGIPLD